MSTGWAGMYIEQGVGDLKCWLDSRDLNFAMRMRGSYQPFVHLCCTVSLRAMAEWDMVWGTAA